MRICGFFALTSQKCQLYSTYFSYRTYVLDQRGIQENSYRQRPLQAYSIPPFSLSPFGFARDKLEGEGKEERGWEANLGSAH
jgi:hypothetical protein